MNPMKIAVWNTAFLGDSILTLPLIQALHQTYPAATIDFYVRGGNESLFSAQPGIRVIPYAKNGKDKGLASFLKLRKQIAETGYDLWMGTHLSLRSSVMALGSGAKRIGYTEGALSSLVYSSRVKRNFGVKPEIERLLELMRPLGVNPDTLDENIRWPHLVLSEDAQSKAKKLLEVWKQPAPILALNPGSVWPTKRWTPEGFAHVMRRAAHEGAHVLLLAAPNEMDTAQEVLRLSGLEEKNGNFLDLSGKTSLPVLAALLGQVQCYLTNDSGPMHLAWVQKTPVTALFGPTVESFGFAPRGRSSIMQVNEPCRPCGLHGHKSCPQKHFRCMKNIRPDDVWEDVRQKLFSWEK